MCHYILIIIIIIFRDGFLDAHEFENLLHDAFNDANETNNFRNETVAAILKQLDEDEVWKMMPPFVIKKKSG